MITGYYRSVAWNSLAQFGGQAINLGVLFVLTTRLSPELFGIFAATLFVVALSGALIEFGLLSNLIYQDEITRQQKTGAALISLILFIGVWCALDAYPEIISGWMDVEGTGQLAQIALLGFLLVPVSIGSDAQIRKENKYRNLAIANLGSVFLSGIIAIGCVYSGYLEIALVAQFISHNLMRSLLLFCQCPWLPKLGPIGAMFPGMGYSAKTTFNNAQLQLSETIDTLIVSRLFGADGLGIYAIALRLASYPLNKIKHIMGMVLFPAFVKARETNEALFRQSIEVRLNAVCWVSPVFVAIAVSAAYIEPLYFQDRWQGVGHLISIMCVGFALEMLFFGQSQLLQAKGCLNSLNLAVAFQIVCFFLVAHSLAPSLGLPAVAYALAVSRLLQAIYLACVCKASLKLSLFDYLAPILPALATVTLFAIIGLGLKRINDSIWGFSGILCVSALITYLIQAWIFCRTLPETVITRRLMQLLPIRGVRV